jgi:hypothetical protein
MKTSGLSAMFLPASQNEQGVRSIVDARISCPPGGTLAMSALKHLSDVDHSETSGTRRFRRGQPRVPVNLPVVVEHASVSMSALARDLGLGGMFVEADLVLPYGSDVVVLVQLPGFTEPSRLPGIVRWSREHGFGVQFSPMSARETYAITALVAAAKAGPDSR